MIAAILLAAGRSRRMGRPKLVLPFGDRCVIGRIVDELARSDVEEIFVVTGPDRHLVERALEGSRVRWVTNPSPESEMLDSARCGVRALPDHATCAMVVLGDQPGVTAELINRLIAAHRQTGRSLVLPVHNGHRGHPLLIGTCHREEILTRHDNVGLRGLLQQHAGEILEVPVDSPWLLEDMDEPADYTGLLAALAATRK
jgi:molybdenum cofactor cytidylyltransferase